MPVSARALREALGAVVGPDRLASDRPALDAYRVDGAQPAWAARPGTVDEVSRLMALAAEERLAVAPWGSGTAMSLGHAPRRLDLVCDLGRLAAVLDYEPADLTVTVQCGISLEALRARLGEHRQFLPLDPAPGPLRSVGGVLATNASGPLRARYGTPRDLLLGIRFVQADGTLTWGGARVVKSVTGYDVPKLMVGALGTLGVLVEATLRLHPLPDAEATWLVACPGFESAAALFASILDSSLEPSRLELANGPALDRQEATALVSVASAPEAVRAQGEALRALAHRVGGRPEPGASEVWGRLARCLGAADVLVKVAGLPSDAAALAGEVERLASGAGVRALVVGEAGNGVLHAGFEGRLPAERWDREVVAPLRARVAPAGGGVVVERAPRELKERLDVWGPPDAEALGIMRRLKSEFDPLGILNPGRFVGGL